MTRIKICGITSPDDALACTVAGADAIGMLVDVRISPRCITADQARQITSVLPPFVSSVMVMMPSTAGEVIDAARKVRPTAVQLHGSEQPEMLRMIKLQLPGIRLIKTIHVGDGGEGERACQYEGVADAILLDTASPRGGGTGATHDWRVSREIIGAVRLPVILAGGLGPKNVADAIRTAKPYAVDVCSGVEAEKRRKDIRLVREFIEQARITT